MGFSDIHIFPFSAREGTKAYNMQRISPDIIKMRKKILKKVRDELHEKYMNLMLNSPQNVIFESKEEGLSVGYSQYYIRIYAQTDEICAIIKPTQKFKEGLLGEIKYE